VYSLASPYATHREKEKEKEKRLTRKESITPDHRRVRKYQPEKKKKLVSTPEEPDANKNIKKGRRTGADGCAHQSYLYNIERRTTIKLDKTNNNNSNNERKKKRKVTRREAYDQSDPVGCVHLRHLHILHRGGGGGG
jgi:hypothetical protein